MKRYAVLYCPDPLGVLNQDRRFVGESNTFRGAKIIKGKFVKKDPHEYKHCIIVDAHSDDGSWVFIMDASGDRSRNVISMCSVFNAYSAAGKLSEVDFV